jgi:hypothetical protein
MIKSRRLLYKSILSAIIILSLVPGCGGGGSSVAHLKGVLTDGFGAVIFHPSAVVTLDGTDVIAHPDSNGAFSITADAGKYTLRGNLFGLDAGFLLTGTEDVTLTEGQTLDIGAFEISNKTLESAWESYRNGQYKPAENSFLNYLDQVRAGQAHMGESSVYSGLGWTRGRGLNDPVQAIEDFQKAINGWDGNLDAMVGLSAAELSSLKTDGTFHFNQSLQAITSAIDVSGDYSSYPTHDHISEVDLMAFRALVNWLNGNTSAAVTEAQAISDQVNISGNSASENAIAIILGFGN